MLYSLAADLVLVVHLAFILFAAFGGLLVLRWRWIVVPHLAAAVWAALIEFAGWICPLTPLENWFRGQAGAAGYEGGFIEHYLLPVIYPGGLTRGVQVALGVLVLVLNLGVYGWILYRIRKGRAGGGGS